MMLSNVLKHWIIDIGKILLLTVTLFAGLILSRLILYRLDFMPPRIPNQASESIAVYYLLSGSFLLSLGLFPLVRRIHGSILNRAGIIFLFFFTCFSVSVTIESSIYSSVQGYHLMIVTLIFPILLFSVISAVVSQTVKYHKKKPDIPSFFKSRPLIQWIWRSLLAIISFPIVYFLLGIIVSPFVADYYKDTIPGLVLPEPGLIILVQLVRSTLFLIVTLPVIIFWGGNMKECIIFLGLAHFVMVFLYDILMALEMPVQLIIIHGFEILFDSFIYAWIFVTLMFPKHFLKRHPNNTGRMN